MSHYTDEPRYTIEQIDLLQRLRRTGMTKPEILHALETLERLDREHSDKFGRRLAPPSSSSSATVTAAHANNGAPALANSLVAAGNNNSSSTSASAANTSSPAATSSNCNASAAAAATTTTSTATQTAYRGAALSPSSNSANNYDTSPPPHMALPLPLPPPPSMPSPLPVPTSAQNGRGVGDALAVMPNGKLSPPRYSVTGAPPRPYGYEPTDEELDIEDKVEELMRSVQIDGWMDGCLFVYCLLFLFTLSTVQVLTYIYILLHLPHRPSPSAHHLLTNIHTCCSKP